MAASPTSFYCMRVQYAQMVKEQYKCLGCGGNYFMTRFTGTYLFRNCFFVSISRRYGRIIHKAKIYLFSDVISPDRCISTSALCHSDKTIMHHVVFHIRFPKSGNTRLQFVGVFLPPSGTYTCLLWTFDDDAGKPESGSARHFYPRPDSISWTANDVASHFYRWGRGTLLGFTLSFRWTWFEFASFTQ